MQENIFIFILKRILLIELLLDMLKSNMLVSILADLYITLLPNILWLSPFPVAAILGHLNLTAEWCGIHGWVVKFKWLQAILTSQLTGRPTLLLVQNVCEPFHKLVFLIRSGGEMKKMPAIYPFRTISLRSNFALTVTTGKKTEPNSLDWCGSVGGLLIHFSWGSHPKP